MRHRDGPGAGDAAKLPVVPAEGAHGVLGAAQQQVVEHALVRPGQCPELGQQREGEQEVLGGHLLGELVSRRAPRSSCVGRCAARELKHLAGSLPRFVSPDRRFPSAARVGDVASVQFASRRSSSSPPVAGDRCRVRGHRAVTAQACSRHDHPATSTITPAPCGVGVSRSAQSQYSSGMRSLAFHHPGFNPVRAQPGTRADARSSVSSTGGVPSRAAKLKRWASRRTRAEALGR